MKTRFLVMMILTGFLNTGCFLAEITRALTGAKKKASSVAAASNNQNNEEGNNNDPGPVGPVGAKGEVDEAWGDGGTLTIPGEDSEVRNPLVAINSKGEVYVGAHLFKSNDFNDVGFCKLTEDGQIDNDIGCVDINDDGNSEDLDSLVAMDVVDSDGSIILVGNVTVDFETNVFVSRFLADGTKDDNFGSNNLGGANIGGVYREDLGCQADIQLGTPNKLMINQQTSQIFLHASTFDGEVSDQGLYAYELDGSRIASFGDGNTTAGLSCESELFPDVSTGNLFGLENIEISPSGGFIRFFSLFGQIGNSIQVAGINGDGLPDLNFGNSGSTLIEEINKSKVFIDSFVDSEGRTTILFAESDVEVRGNPQFKMLRLLSNGVLDEEFASGGVRELPEFIDSASGIPFFISKFETDSLGQTFLFMGATGLTATRLGLGEFIVDTVAKLSSDGTLDKEFGVDGLFSLNLDLGEIVTDVALDNEGRILISGQGPTSSIEDPFNPGSFVTANSAFIKRIK